MRLRLTPEDDLLHSVEAASTYNESRYYNFFDPGCGLGGWVRLGNRPNEGYAEMTVCLYLPDGRVAFMYDRPAIDGNAAHDAGGLRFEVVTPHDEHRVTYDRKALLLDEPTVMEDPRRAFTENPTVPCRVDLRAVAVAPPFGGEPEVEEGDVLPDDVLGGFARGHTEQHTAVTGTVAVGEHGYALTGGLGLRDHSWGPRTWQAVWWYRWLTVNLGPDLGMAATVIGRPDGTTRRHGYVYDHARLGPDTWVPVRDVTLSTDHDDRGHHRTVRAAVDTGSHTYELTGEVWSSIPLRNRRDGKVTRIVEGMTTWRCEGRVGSGLSEYLDQIVDGRPAGHLDGG